VPWAVPASLALLWLGWRFAGGQPPWRRSPERQLQRRANAVSAATFAWALAANAFSLIALAGLWILLKQLVRLPGNRLPDFSVYPLPIIVLVLGCAAIVGAVSEEVGLRGYLQSRFERFAPWPVAVGLMALIAAPGHALTQGFVWPTLLFYFLADTSYGVTAYLTNSILPGILAHAVGLFVFFLFIWPHDAARPHMSNPDPAFWTLVAQVMAFGALTIWAFLRLARTTAAARARVGAASHSPTG
jgi:membrane protease YdiL (CAAX protease family)